ncbi:MAG TPA: carboxyl transferase domain-containing protein [Patescibacteria group bacterium]|nr:carboxyl transferase domain-containing protein [Patescibacteria group bacterium]
MAHERFPRDAHDESTDNFPMGEGLDPAVAAMLRPPEPPKAIDSLYAGRPALDPVAAMEEFMGAVDLRERFGHMKIVDDVIGLRRTVGGTIETYRDKLMRAESRSDKTESARFGVGAVMGERAVIYAQNWDYFAGSLGEVAGEKFVLAAELAEHESLPFVSIAASSGVRQHENILGLVQMQRMAMASKKLRRTNLPYISVLAGQAWGGVSASAVPVADIVMALEGTDYGFAGPRVIETFEGRSVAPGAQSAEANLLDRNIDVLVKDVPELLEFLGQALKAVRRSQAKHIQIPEWHRDLHIDAHAISRPMHFGEQGFSPALVDRQAPVRTVHVERQRADVGKINNAERLMARYNEMTSGARRLDTDFIMREAFDSVVPLYNVAQFEELKKYPNIIAGIASIGDQSFMVIGDQPSYKAFSDTYVSKHAPNPGPEDFEYEVRMIEAAERWKLPIVFMTDTLGALPTLAAERRGQSRAIAEAIAAASSHPYPVISVITGALGSGGGLATTPFGRHTVMLDSALAFVSEPRSMASILYNTANPTDEQVSMTLETVRASAADLQAQGLVDTVVTDSNNPYQTVADLRRAIIEGFEKQVGKSPRRLRAETDKRLTPKMIGRSRK